ncbi:hypothetical protein FS842_003174 [Serendipita sp. 407]|nr:hypothetical protein FS842_003174 [Serendipita sp. 407]
MLVGRAQAQRQVSSSTAQACFNKPLFRPTHLGIRRKWLGLSDNTRLFASDTAQARQPLYKSFTQGRTSNRHFSTGGTKSSFRYGHCFGKGQARPYVRLETHQPPSPFLAHIGQCGAECHAFGGSFIMMDTMRRTDESWRRVQASLVTRQRRYNEAFASQQRRELHSSHKSQGWPAIWGVATLLKSSGALSWVQVVGRVALTLLPMAVIKRSVFRKLIKHLPVSEHPTLATLHSRMQSSIKVINVTLWGILILPGALFLATILASLERTPVTGRWRLILLSPEEERGVATDLAGEGWRDAVANILTEGDTEPLPRVIPLSDWRTQWVLETWRHLESVVPLLQADVTQISQAFGQLAQKREGGEEVIPFPPPSEYPLFPRPRATTLLHAFAPCMSDVMEEEAVAALSADVHPTAAGQPVDTPNHQLPTSQDPPAHALLGPPYSLLLVEKPEYSNAFSYGFGPDGAGGVVVYSGFIDDILRKTQPARPSPPIGNPNPAGRSLLSYFTGSTSQPAPSSQPSTPDSQYVTPTHHVPTEEQTTLLAILLAHELAHLILSHHLETLSSNSILIPTVVGMFSDLARTLAFPFTMVFGPFVNDALWEVSKLGSGEVMKNSEACTVKGLEVEADLVGAR